MKSLFFVLPALLLGLTACGAPVAAYIGAVATLARSFSDTVSGK